eukprot:g5212.t1
MAAFTRRPMAGVWWLVCFGLVGFLTPSFLLAGRVGLTRRTPARTRQLAENGLFGQVAELFEGPAFEEGEQWRALTRIKVRKEPSIKAPQLEDKVIEKGETFYVSEVRRAKLPTGDKHRLYLRLAASKGWVFDLGVAGDWYGKYIAEKVYEDEGGDSNPLGGIGDAMGNVIITALTVAQPPRGKEALRDEIRKCRQLTDKPFGVNITLLPVGVPPDFDGIVQVLIEEKVKVIETAGRNPEKVIKKCKDCGEAGMFVIHKCVAVRHAQTAAKMGADMISMDGFDCGGHPGGAVAIRRTATGVQLAAALAMGAEGVNMGTRFMATKEAPILQPIKDTMVKAKVTDGNTEAMDSLQAAGLAAVLDVLAFPLLFSCGLEASAQLVAAGRRWRTAGKLLPKVAEALPRGLCVARADVAQLLRLEGGEWHEEELPEAIQKLALGRADGGLRGLYAVEPVEEGETLLSLPLETILWGHKATEATTPCHERIAQFFDVARHPENARTHQIFSLMTLTLSVQRHLNLSLGRYGLKGQHLELWLQKPLKRPGEITDVYGLQSNEETLWSFGFTVPWIHNLTCLTRLRVHLTKWDLPRRSTSEGGSEALLGLQEIPEMHLERLLRFELDQGAPTYLNCAASFFMEQLFVVGGSGPWFEGCVPFAQSLELSSRCWQSLPSMAIARSHCAAVGAEDCLLVLGGQDGHPLDVVEALLSPGGAPTCPKMSTF